MAFPRSQEEQQQEDKSLKNSYLRPEQMNSGLARYQSAPSSYFSSFVDANRNVNNRGGDYSVDDLDNLLDGLMPINQISVHEHGSSMSNTRTLCQPQVHHHQQHFNPVVAMNSNSNLFRYHSSPAGVFSGLNAPIGIMSHLPEITERSMREKDPLITVFGTENKDDEVQNGVTTIFPPASLLLRHLSMPTTSTELYGVETQIQDSVLCKFRAKRGCATHPRSIAERVRRTRISERMRKLQELVPNMEKQSNTADMLDLAVEYIKGLQKEVKILSEKRSQCTCSKYH